MEVLLKWIDEKGWKRNEIIYYNDEKKITIFLSHRKVTDNDCKLFVGLECEKLFLENNEIGDEGCKHLVDAKCFELFLRKNKIGDKGCEYLKYGTYRSLNLTNNKNITEVGYTHLMGIRCQNPHFEDETAEAHAKMNWNWNLIPDPNPNSVDHIRAAERLATIKKIQILSDDI
jgi:hypothetical protein